MFVNFCQSIIKPSKISYNLFSLGSNKLKFGNYNVFRDDFQLESRNFRMECSFYQIYDSGITNTFPCVVYSHCLGGSRLEANSLVEPLLKNGIQLFTFDFPGFGMSEGKYTTFGVKESEDIETVVKWLYNSGKVSSISLWGRSMGAVATLIFSSKTNFPLSSLVLDSPFSNFENLVKEISKSKYEYLPNFLMNGLWKYVKEKIEEMGNFKVNELNLKNPKGPLALFIASKEDKFVSCKHSEDLFVKYKKNSEAYIQYVLGDHNEHRSDNLIKEIIENFLKLSFYSKKTVDFNQIVLKKVEKKATPFYFVKKNDGLKRPLTTRKVYVSKANNSYIK